MADPSPPPGRIALPAVPLRRGCPAPDLSPDYPGRNIRCWDGIGGFVVMSMACWDLVIAVMGWILGVGFARRTGGFGPGRCGAFTLQALTRTAGAGRCGPVRW